MLYVGLDLHIKTISICVLNAEGEVRQRDKVKSVDEMMQVLGRLPDRFAVCYEASCGYGYYHDLLRPLAARIVVAHPGKLKLIFNSKRKNDRQDAQKLAMLLLMNAVPKVHVPSARVREWRQLITFRRHLV